MLPGQPRRPRSLSGSGSAPLPSRQATSGDRRTPLDRGAPASRGRNLEASPARSNWEPDFKSHLPAPYLVRSRMHPRRCLALNAVPAVSLCRRACVASCSVRFVCGRRVKPRHKPRYCGILFHVAAAETIVSITHTGGRGSPSGIIR